MHDATSIGAWRKCYLLGAVLSLLTFLISFYRAPYLCFKTDHPGFSVLSSVGCSYGGIAIDRCEYATGQMNPAIVQRTGLFLNFDRALNYPGLSAFPGAQQTVSRRLGFEVLARPGGLLVVFPMVVPLFAFLMLFALSYARNRRVKRGFPLASR